jgi:Ca2+-binding EF-hand superfamily protein
MKLIATATITLCLGAAACQSGLGGKTAEQPSPARMEYISQFKKIDATGKGRITMDQAVTYYSTLFTELDRNGDGFLDAAELETLVPIMNARSGRELLLALDRNSDNKISRSEFVVIANWLSSWLVARMK